ncbi:MAG: hypothetical protein J6333_00995 [Planctomycetes bacterium]|nr:hypothetical protein [Planctomycetota bacterium]
MRALSSFFAACALSLAALAAETPPPAAPGKTAPRSVKRGVCVNKFYREDAAAMAPGVAWYYNWAYASDDVYPGCGMEYVPMVWGANQECLDGFKAYLQKHPKPEFVLALNEPNLRGQAFVTPEVAAKAYNEIRAFAKSQGIKIVGPHMAVGSPENDSVKAVDPFEKKEVTYRFFLPYMKAFFHFVGGEGSDGADAVAVHSYGNIYELRWVVETLSREYGKPIWVTEFNWTEGWTPQQQKEYMIQAVDFMESCPAVARYAWFKERMGPTDKCSLFTDKPGELTDMGRTYVNMPTHSPAYFAPLPGKVEAENYARAHATDVTGIAATSDAEGFLEMRLPKPESYLEYQVELPKAGTYKLSFRVLATGKANLRVSRDGWPCAETNDEKGDGQRQWRTLAATAKLPAGKQALRLSCGNEAISVNWLACE